MSPPHAATSKDRSPHSSPAHLGDAALGASTNPAAALAYEALPDNPMGSLDVDVRCPARDRVPPALVDLLVTNTGPYHPSYVYRLLSELYSPLDRDLSGE